MRREANKNVLNMDIGPLLKINYRVAFMQAVIKSLLTGAHVIALFCLFDWLQMLGV